MEIPKIVQMTMQRLHRAGFKPHMESVDVIDTHPADPSVGVMSGFQVVEYRILLTPIEGFFPVYKSSDGQPRSLMEFHSGKRSNSLLGAVTLLATLRNIDDFGFAVKGSKLYLYIDHVTDLKDTVPTQQQVETQNTLLKNGEEGDLEDDL